jgi:predicted phage tail protein
MITDNDANRIFQIESENAQLRQRVKELEKQNAQYLNIFAEAERAKDQRIRELEAKLSDANSRLDKAINASDKYMHVSMEEYRKLEAEVAGLKVAIKKVVDTADYQTGNEPECSVDYFAMKELKNALSTPTGNAILAKVEAADEMFKTLVKVEFLFNDEYTSKDEEFTCPLCHWGSKHGHSKDCQIGKALAAYREACESEAKNG